MLAVGDGVRGPFLFCMLLCVSKLYGIAVERLEFDSGRESLCGFLGSPLMRVRADPL